MRPLVVLLLVVGALAALLFALMTFSGGRHTADKPLVAVTQSPKTKPTSELAEPGVPTAEARAVTDPSRQAVQPDGLTGPQGPKVQFAGVDGIVTDEDNKPIAEARISLLNIKNTGMEPEDLAIMSGVDLPKPAAKDVTGKEGTFHFEKLDPRKPWMIVVDHDRYLRFSDVLPLTEGEVRKESVMLKPGQTCTGVVRAANGGQPIVGAKLVLDNPMALARPTGKKKNIGQVQTMTDASGQYSFSSAGISITQPRMLTVSAQGYATQVIPNFTMVDMTTPSNRFKNVQPSAVMQAKSQDFELEPGKVIAGRVLSPEHKGVAGIEIQALAQSGTVGCQGEGTSGAKGEFLIEGLAEGIYTVRITPTEYDAHALQRVEAGDTNVTIELFELASVTGKVLAPSGEPMTSFTVKARMANEISSAYGAVMGQKRVSSKDGTFEIGGLGEGSYVIEADAPNYASSFSDTFTVTQGLLTSDIVVTMTLGGTLSGQIVDTYNNAPVVGAEIKTVENEYIENDIFELFSALEPSALSKATVYTDAEGRFEVKQMTPGTYQIQVRGKGFAPVFVHDVEVVDGKNTEMPATQLSRGASLSGVVYGRDAAICPGASVQLSPTDSTQLNGGRQTRADSTGRFVLDNVEPGSYQLSATRPNSNTGNPFEAIGDMRQSQIEISLEDGVQYQFELHMGASRGN